IMKHRAIHHGGGINGFLTESLYLPDEDLAIAVLVNTAGPVGPSALARQIIEAMVGDNTPEPMTFDGDLAYFEGVYGGPARAGQAAIRIAADGDILTATTVMQADQEAPEDNQEAQNLDFRGGMTFTMGDAILIFEGDEDQASVLRYDVGFGYTVMQRR
ncbi:MAG: hypothetical protein OXI83_20080, partial [Gemmatimonadota bacterium]|nr:hypothetical protein [Gemmatimonadota bacterium]